MQLAFRSTDGEIAHCMSAAMLVFVTYRAGAVRHERMMFPVRKQGFLLLVEDHGSTNDQATVRPGSVS